MKPELVERNFRLAHLPFISKLLVSLKAFFLTTQATLNNHLIGFLIADKIKTGYNHTFNLIIKQIIYK